MHVDCTLPKGTGPTKEARELWMILSAEVDGGDLM
jgi:hypothetical protein